MKSFYNFLITAGTAFQDFLLLFIRLFWGISFLTSGLGKLLDPASVAAFFESLHIPFPLANAYIAGSIEFFGGICLILGFASRFVAIPLMIVMTVALLTAHGEAIAELSKDPYVILKQTPFTYLLAAALIFAFGPGRISLDALIKRFYKP